MSQLRAPTNPANLSRMGALEGYVQDEQERRLREEYARTSSAICPPSRPSTVAFQPSMSGLWSTRMLNALSPSQRVIDAVESAIRILAELQQGVTPKAQDVYDAIQEARQAREVLKGRAS